MIKAIVYTSNAGHTKRYAQMLGEITGINVYSLYEAERVIEDEAEVIYMGWLSAMRIKGYKEAKRRFNVRGICAVGMCETGSIITDVRRANGIKDGTPLFTLQGGIDISKLRGINRAVISVTAKGLREKKDKSPEEEKMAAMLSRGADFVCEENLMQVLAFVKAGCKPA